MSPSHGSLPPVNAEGEQESPAGTLDKTAFADPSSGPKTIEVIWSFIRSYDQHRHDLPLNQWLVLELGKYPHLWKDTSEVERVAGTLIAAIERTNRNKESLQKHLDKGKSSTNWLARELEQDAQDNPALDLGAYAGQVQDMLQSANTSLARTLGPDGRHSTVPMDQAADASTPQKPSTVRDDTSRLTIAKDISNQALLNAALNASYHGARTLGQRAWNWLQGRENVPASEALQEFFESSLKSSQHIGAQVAVSGAVVVAAKSGWLSFFRDTPVEVLATTTYTGLERAKALYKLGQGDILADAAINAIEQATTVAARSLAQVAEKKGAQLGARWGMALGAAFGPQGAAIGGVVGGIAGGLAGKVVGKFIEEGGRKIVETAKRVVHKVADTIRQGVSAVADGFKRATDWLFG